MNSETKRCDLTTKRDLFIFIKTCHQVMIQVRFGVSERWVKISKREAMDLANNLSDDATATDCEMYSGTFGQYDFKSGNLYLG
jgi:hypothetical protein